MRKEADAVGPRAELEHWKKRMAKFDSLTACVRSPHYRAVINVLVASKSKVIEVGLFLMFRHVHSTVTSGLLLSNRPGRNWTCLSQTSPMRLKTM